MSRRKRRENHSGGGAFTILLVCVLAVPTCAVLTGVLPEIEWTPEGLESLLLWFEAGAVLGVVNLLLRPLLRLLSAPIGCVTLGLFGFVIDVALIYLSAMYVAGYEVPGMLYAVITAALVNTICAVVGAR